jgi:hypothetical protein
MNYFLQQWYSHLRNRKPTHTLNTFHSLGRVSKPIQEAGILSVIKWKYEELEGFITGGSYRKS